MDKFDSSPLPLPLPLHLLKTLPPLPLPLPPPLSTHSTVRSLASVGNILRIPTFQPMFASETRRKRFYKEIKNEQTDRQIPFPNKSRRLNDNKKSRLLFDTKSLSDELNVFDYSDQEKENCYIIHGHKRWEGFRTDACNYEDNLEDNPKESRRITEESLINIHALCNFSGNCCANCEYADRTKPNDERTPIIHAVDCIGNLLICDSLSFLEKTKPIPNLIERSRKRAIEWKELGKQKEEKQEMKEKYKENKQKDGKETFLHNLDINHPFFPIRMAQLNMIHNPLICFNFENITKDELPTEGLDVLFSFHEYRRTENISIQDLENDKNTIRDVWDSAKRYAKRRMERARIIKEDDIEITRVNLDRARLIKEDDKQPTTVKRRVPFDSSEGEEYFKYRKHQLLREYFWDMIQEKTDV
ncbi:MAG: flagella basal body P-ring formation protein FlgA [Desulfobacterales bacterium]|nr:flagella basal body P-ring formation protein FlgA [Desulfobacterales bacterium]